MKLPQQPAAAPTLISVLLASLASCGGGGGGSSQAPPPGGGGGDRAHLYVAGVGGGTSLFLVDPSAPSSPALVAGSAGVAYAFNPVFSGTPDPVAGVLRDAQVDRVALASGTRLLELSLAAGQSAPALNEIIDLGAAVGDVMLGEDLSGPVPTVHYAVEVGGAGQYQTFSQTGGAVSTPVPFPGEPLTFVGSPADGSFSGWVALESGMLTRVTAGLAVTNLTSTSTASVVDGTDDASAFFAVDAGFGCIRSDDSYVDVAFTPVASGSFSPSDFAVAGSTALYFASPTGANSFEIVRALTDGSAAAVTADIPGTPTYLNVTPTRVLCGYDSPAGGGSNLTSFDLDGGDEQTLEAGVAGIELAPLRTPGLTTERVVYGLTGIGTVDVATDGSDRRLLSGATPAGVAFAQELTLGNAFSIASVYLTSPAPAGGTTLSSLVPGDAGGPVELGVIPAGFTDVSASALFTGTAIVTALDAGQSDVFVATSGVADSLRRVTSTPSTFELGTL